MEAYSLKILKSRPGRLLITVAGISLCIILMLFLLGIYKGVADGSVEYIKRNDADLWVLQKSADNILRGTSILSTFQMMQVFNYDNVENIAPVMLVLSSVKIKGKTGTIFLCGYNTSSDLGGPPHIVKGRKVEKLNEIVLDRSFAQKHKIGPGDYVTIMEDSLKVVGICSGTNAFVIQYGFAAIRKVHSLIGYNDIYTCFLIKLKNNKDINRAAAELAAIMPGCNVYTHEQFIKNNMKEMEAGILPLLYTIAAISGIVLITILSLILSINILEKKKEFAVMKILGCPGNFLPGLIFSQALVIALLSAAAGLTFYFPLVKLIENLSPEISVKNDFLTSALVVASAVVMSQVSSFFAARRIRKIYPLEVFS